MSKTTEPAKLCWNGAREVGVGEVEDGEKREITDVRRHGPIERRVRQPQSGDPSSASAARDADPAAEGRAGRPVAGEDAERVGELGFEGKQGGEVGVAAIAVGRGERRRRR